MLAICHPETASQSDSGNVPTAPWPHRTAAAPVTPWAPDPLAMLAHDVRGPLANLALLIEAMAEDTSLRGSDRLAGKAAKAGRIIDRLEGMLSATLERSRRGDGVLQPAHKLVDVADLVDTVAILNRPLAEKRRVRLHCLIAEPLPAPVDAHLMMRAVDNLLGNAITLTRPRGLVLCEAAPGSDGSVLVRITDQGPGLTTDEITTLFRPFLTVPRNASETRRSTGLGLAIVRHVAEAHGGSVEVHSDGPGKGASFLLRLHGQTRRT